MSARAVCWEQSSPPFPGVIGPSRWLLPLSLSTALCVFSRPPAQGPEPRVRAVPALWGTLWDWLTLGHR
jgi:hypothetical protein